MFFVSKFIIWFKNGSSATRSVVRRVLPGKILVVILNKIGCSRRIVPGILKLTFRRGWSNFSIVFSFVGCEEKEYSRFVSVLQLGFTAASTAGAAGVWFP